ncbi:MAG: OadG family protein [Candidatus Cloacimonetes bacterium]|nr:OadG family protein [Candidatus Cloacimonadota bacterium]
MKKIYITLIFSFFVLLIYSQEAYENAINVGENVGTLDFSGRYVLGTLDFDSRESGAQTLPPKLHSMYELEGNHSIRYVTDKLDIPLYRFIPYFRINTRDPRILESSLTSQGITVYQVYQLYSLDKFGFTDDSTILEVSQRFNIPFKKLANYLELNPQDLGNRAMTIQESGYEAMDMIQYLERFQHERLNYISTLTVLGMLVVFSALILVALVVSHLTIFEPKKLAPIKIATPVGTISTQQNEFTNLEDSICAVVAAVHRFKSEIAIDHKILLTYRRIDVSMWSASGKTEMPNKHFNLLRKK